MQINSYIMGEYQKDLPFFDIWPLGQAVKTSPFHGGIRGSIPLEATKRYQSNDWFFYIKICNIFFTLLTLKIYNAINFFEAKTGVTYEIRLNNKKTINFATVSTKKLSENEIAYFNMIKNLTTFDDLDKDYEL